MGCEVLEGGPRKLKIGEPERQVERVRNAQRPTQVHAGADRSRDPELVGRRGPPDPTSDPFLQGPSLPTGPQMLQASPASVSHRPVSLARGPQRRPSVELLTAPEPASVAQLAHGARRGLRWD